MGRAPEYRGDPKWPKGYKPMRKVLRKPTDASAIVKIDHAIHSLDAAERLLYNAFADEALAAVKAAREAAVRARKNALRRLAKQKDVTNG